MRSPKQNAQKIVSDLKAVPAYQWKIGISTIVNFEVNIFSSETIVTFSHQNTVTLKVKLDHDYRNLSGHGYAVKDLLN